MGEDKAQDRLDSQGPFKTEEGKSFALRPDSNTYVPVNDVRDQWKAESEQHPITKEQRDAFFRQRVSLVESSNVGDEHKQALLESLNRSLREDESVESEVPPTPMPKPGGVGYGAYYKDGLLEFQNHSVLYFKIVINPAIGNAVNKWLYATSTNRAPKGLEAYVCYHHDDNPTFNIFDWSKVTTEEQFALARSYSSLDDYLVPRTEAGKVFQTLHVLNSTRRLAGTKWINEVMVYKSSNNGYDLVYTSQYDLDPFDETKYLWWGPIIETFPPFPFVTNELGFFDAQLVQDGGPSVILTSAVTDLKTDHVGAKVVFERPHYSFIVHW